MNVRSSKLQLVEDLAEKKQAIFESALALIREHGFHGAPMSLVAKNAGVACGTVYHYFASKEQLICELYDYNVARVIGIIDAILEENIPFKEKFFKIWTNLYGFYVKQPNVLIFFEQFVNSPFNTDRSPRHFRGKLYSFFSEGIKSGQVKTIKPEILLVLVMGSINTTAKLHLFGNMPLRKNDLHRITEILWDGIASPWSDTAMIEPLT